MGPTKRGKPVKRQDAPGIKRESSTLFVYGSYAVGVAVSCVAVILGLLLNKNSGLGMCIDMKVYSSGYV